MGWKIDDFNPVWVRLLGRSQLSNPSDLHCFHNFLKNNCSGTALNHTQILTQTFESSWPNTTQLHLYSEHGTWAVGGQENISPWCKCFEFFTIDLFALLSLAFLDALTYHYLFQLESTACGDKNMHFAKWGFPIFTLVWWDSRWCFLADFQLASTTCERKDSVRNLGFLINICLGNLQLIISGITLTKLTFNSILMFIVSHFACFLDWLVNSA